MELTKFTHSCVRFDDGDRSLVVDPGVFSETGAALDGVDGVLITHEHPDHIGADALRAAVARDPRLMVWAPRSVADQLGLGDQVTVVSPDESFDVAGFPIRTFGGQHAVIHPTIPVVANIGYLIADRVYHPGDSFVVPPTPVELLLAPLHAPWSSTGQVIDFVVAVRAPRTANLHDSLLTETGLGFVEGHLGRIAGQHGVEYNRIAVADTITV